MHNFGKVPETNKNLTVCLLLRIIQFKMFREISRKILSHISLHFFKILKRKKCFGKVPETCKNQTVCLLLTIIPFKMFREKSRTIFSNISLHFYKILRIKHFGKNPETCKNQTVCLLLTIIPFQMFWENSRKNHNKYITTCTFLQNVKEKKCFRKDPETSQNLTLC